MTSAQAHCPSYYAASRNDRREYPPLAATLRADVCVIGGGFTGVATALTLAERGYQVVLLEQNRIGWGASGRNGGQLINGMSGERGLYKFWGADIADTLRDLGYRGHEIIASRVAQYGIECDLKYGYIDLATKASQWRELQQSFEAQCSSGLGQQLRLVAADQLPALVGTDRYHGGLINNRNGHLHPLNLCLGEARAAADLGVSIHEGSEVTAIQPGARAVVRTAGGEVSADFVVLAGNAYQQLERRALSGLVFPAGSYILATEPLTEAEVAAVNPQDLAACDLNEVLDYFRLSADKRLLFGGRCNYSGREPASIEGAMRPRLRRIFPQLAHKRIDYAWGGKIGIVVNRVPLLGRSQPNVFYSIGYSGHGVNMTHACGEIIADAVAGTLEHFDLFARVPHRRLPGGQKLGGQMVAMGMLYYRLRDIL